MKIHLHQGDLPNGLDLGKLVAIDTETLGLNPHRDRLCLAQLSAGDGVCHAVQFKAGEYAAPNLKRLLGDLAFGHQAVSISPASMSPCSGSTSIRCCRADLLHQDRLQAGARTLYRPAWA